MSEISTSVPVGLPDPFTVVHNRLQYGSTVRIPTTLYFSGAQTLVANELKSALAWSTTGGLVTITGANDIWKTFRPPSGGYIRVPIFNHIQTGSTDLTFTGSANITGTTIINGDSSLILKCTAPITATNSTATFTIY